MITRKNARLAALAVAVMFPATMAVLLARQFALGPERPAPDFRTFGPPDAPVRIEEYSDFACGACRAAAGKLDEALKVYPGKLRVALKHYPLSNIHPWSLHAAAYADCAGARGKFKEYADLLFEGQEKWGRAKTEPEEFREYAARLGLDWEELRACSNDPNTLKNLRLDIAEAEMKGVNATPTFFVNGKRAVGPAQLLEQLRKLDKFPAAGAAGR